MNIASDIKELARSNRLTIENHIVDVYQNEHFKLFDNKDIHLHEFVITNKDYDNSKWWDGTKLVPMPKTVVGLCESLNRLVKHNSSSFVFTNNWSKTNSMSTTDSAMTIDDEELSSLSTDSACDQRETQYVFTVSLNTQLVSLVVCNYLAVGMCMRSKKPIMCTDSIHANLDLRLNFTCGDSACDKGCILNKFTDRPIPVNAHVKDLVVFIDDILAYFSYGDSIYRATKTGSNYRYRNLYRQDIAVAKYTFIDSNFVVDRIIDDKDLCSIICQVLIYKK